MKYWKYFPKELGKKAFVSIFAFYTVSLLAVGSSLRLFMHKRINLQAPWVPHFMGELDRFLVQIFWLLIVIALLYFSFFIFRYFSPLGILLKKSEDIRHGIFKRQEGVPIAEKWGEWFQLDLALLKMHRDLKHRKAEFDRERGEVAALVSAANAAILAVGETLLIRYMNDPMMELLDIKDRSVLSKPLNTVLRQQKVVQAFEEALRSRNVTRLETSYQMVQDSSIHFFDITISPLKKDRKGRGQGAIAIFHDITERKRVEKVRMDFVANASHELKTPLTAVHGYVDMLKAEMAEQDDMAALAFSGIGKNLTRLNQLVSDLLHLTKIESTDNVEKNWIYAEDVTDSIIHELKPLWQSKKHVVETIYDWREGALQAGRVFANREYLEQILINLVGNAVKYCEHPARIKVTWSPSSQGVVLSVKDDGPGIESYHLGRVFERFYRVRDKKDAQSIKGTGLGLAIVRHAMLKQGGKVDVKSAPGLGTEFLCFFPMGGAAVQDDQEQKNES